VLYDCSQFIVFFLCIVFHERRRDKADVHLEVLHFCHISLLSCQFLKKKNIKKDMRKEKKGIIEHCLILMDE